MNQYETNTSILLTAQDAKTCSHRHSSIYLQHSYDIKHLWFFKNCEAPLITTGIPQTPDGHL